MSLRNKKLIKRFSENLKQIRKDKNRTQADLAYSIGRNQQSYQRIEAGNSNITIDYIFDIARELNVHPKQLFTIDFEEYLKK